jgi:hypothetical protein
MNFFQSSSVMIVAVALSAATAMAGDVASCARAGD